MRTAKHAILDLLSATDGALPVRGLIRAGQVLQIPENSLRVALSRLKGEGLIVSPGRGQYCLGDAALGVRALVSTWRCPRQTQIDWDGRWIVGMLAGSPTRQETRALELCGTRPLRPGVYVRPNNSMGGLAEQIVRFARAGIDADLVFIASLHGPDDRRARALWDTARLVSGHHEAIARIETARCRLERLPLEAAARLAFEVGGEAIRRIALDPLLPKELVEPTALDALVARMVEFDAQGRELWQRVLEGDADLGAGSPAAVAHADIAFGSAGRELG